MQSLSTSVPATGGYRCRLCGAASYRRLTHRGSDGTMQYSGLYRCSGCSVTFSDPVAWREGSGRSMHEEPGKVPAASAPVTAAPTFKEHDPRHGHILLSMPEGGPLPFGYSEEDVLKIQDAAARATKSRSKFRR